MSQRERTPLAPGDGPSTLNDTSDDSFSKECHPRNRPYRESRKKVKNLTVFHAVSLIYLMAAIAQKRNDSEKL